MLVYTCDRESKITLHTTRFWSAQLDTITKEALYEQFPTAPLQCLQVTACTLHVHTCIAAHVEQPSSVPFLYNVTLLSQLVIFKWTITVNHKPFTLYWSQPCKAELCMHIKDSYILYMTMPATQVG